MLTIYKYKLDGQTTHVEVHKDAIILCVQSQRNDVCIWALVDPRAPKQVRIFHIFGTGSGVPDEDLVYIGTCQTHEGKFVWHVFEEYRS